MGGPLNGVRVVDLTSVILGSFATQMLGDLGAEVLKIENPDQGQATPGDIMRWAGDVHSAGMGPLFMGFNRNKRSLALDLRQARAREQLDQLLAEADVFVASLRMPSLEKLNLGYQRLSQLNPGLIYAHACGFGSDGPYAELPAYDDLIQAASGSADLWPRAMNPANADDATAAHAQTHGAPCYLPGLFADKSVGLYLANAILAALFQRERAWRLGSGPGGQFVEVPMLECFTHFSFSENLFGHTYQPAQGGYGYPRVLNPYRKPYRSRDGYVAILPYSDRQWREFFRAAGCAERFDERFHHYRQRSQNIAALYALMEEIVATRRTMAWIDLLRPLDIPVMPAYRLEQVRDDPHLKAVKLFQPQHHPAIGAYLSLRHPVRYSSAPGLPQGQPPLLGEANAEYLDEH